MSSTEVVERPIFRSAAYLRELVRRNKRRAEDWSVVGSSEPPLIPASAFILQSDEVIECAEYVELEA